MRWLVDFARKRGEKSMELRLAGEMMDAVEGRGAAVKKREDVAVWLKRTRRSRTSASKLAVTRGPGVPLFLSERLLARTTPIEKYRNIGIRLTWTRVNHHH